MVSNVAVIAVSLVLGTLILVTAASETVPYTGYRGYLGDMEGEPDPEQVLAILARLGQTLMRANELEKDAPAPLSLPDMKFYGALMNVPATSSKRGLDLGLSRGFSGSQAAKHLMGLAAANYAGGPGRRRRFA